MGLPCHPLPAQAHTCCRSSPRNSAVSGVLQGETASAELAQVRKPPPPPAPPTANRAPEPQMLPVPLPVRPPWVARLPHPRRNTFHGGGNRIPGFFLLHPGLCPQRGRTKPKRGLGAPLSSADLGKGGPGCPKNRKCASSDSWAVGYKGLWTVVVGRSWAPARGHVGTGSEQVGLTAHAHIGICASV